VAETPVWPAEHGLHQEVPGIASDLNQLYAGEIRRTARVTQQSTASLEPSWAVNTIHLAIKRRFTVACHCHFIHHALRPVRDGSVLIEINAINRGGR
jgi:hypothetical protein